MAEVYLIIAITAKLFLRCARVRVQVAHEPTNLLVSGVKVEVRYASLLSDHGFNGKRLVYKTRKIIISNYFM